MAAEGISDERDAVVSWRDAAGGSVGAVATVAVQLALGVLAFAALGGSAAGAGIPAGFIAILVGGLVVATRAHSFMPAAAPTAQTAVIVAGLVASLAADPEVRVAEQGGLLLAPASSRLGAHGHDQEDAGWRLAHGGLAHLVASEGHRCSRPRFLDVAHRLAGARGG